VPFLLQVYVAGDWNGSTTTNIKINTKWLWLKTHFIIPIEINNGSQTFQKAFLPY
jgi:hypothetical protein